MRKLSLYVFSILRKAKLLQVKSRVQNRKLTIYTLSCSSHWKCNKLWSIVICVVGENRSVGKAKVREKAEKYIFQHTAVFTGCHDVSAKELLAKQAAICAQIETFEPCVTEFGLRVAR